MTKRIALVLVLLLSSAVVVRAQSTAFTYQGHLTDGGVSASGNYDIQFTLKNALTGGVTVGTPLSAAPVAVANGIFTVTLDFDFLPFDGGERWLEIGVRAFGSAAAYTVLVPRQKLTSTPYAIKAFSATSITDGESANNVFPVQGMVWIKPGRFVMGSRAAVPGQPEEFLRLVNEGPQTVVTLTKGFWIGAHEVTQAEYQMVMGSNPSIFTGDTNRPVEMVSWVNAVSYCTTLTTTERMAGKIPEGWSYRLPTEAEWEYCCRAGARTTRFAYGDDLTSASLMNYAWIAQNSGGTTHPVEQKLANAWGLMDMHGNLWEWCLDYDSENLPGGSVTDPRGPLTGSFRVIKGGGWSSQQGAGFLRSARRIGQGTNNGRDYIGFRVVLSPNLPP